MIIRRVIGFTIVAVIVSFWFYRAEQTIGPKFPEELSDVVLAYPKRLKPFNLMDHHGQSFDLDRLKGRWTFLFFGYTYCPDVCPTALGRMAELFQLLSESSSEAQEMNQGVFISVDPKRDTPETLKEYVGYFHPDFVGVTGSEKKLKSFAKQIGALYFLTPQESEDSDMQPDEETYLISHTSAFFLIDPLGRLVAIFPEYNNTDMLFEKYVRIRKFATIRNIYGNSDDYGKN